MAAVTSGVTDTAADYKDVVSLINGSSCSAITKHSKEYLDIIFEDEDSEGMGASSQANLV